MFTQSELVSELQSFFEGRPEILCAYLFGSYARGDFSANSDVDVAVALDPKQFNFRKSFNKLDLLSDLMRALKTDRIDLILLRNGASPELEYRVLTEGLCIKGDGEARAAIEPALLNLYFDHQALLRRNGLTRD